MADISKIEGYDIKDATARSSLVDATTVTTTLDTTPYLYKASEHNVVYDKLVGGTVAWNQYALSIASDNYAGVVSTLTIQDGVATVSNPTARYSSIKTNKAQSNWVNNHRYLVIFDFKANFTVSSVNNFGMYVTGGGKQFGGGFVYSTTNVWKNSYVFMQPTSGVGDDMRLQTQDNNTEYSGHEHSIRNLMCFDLTQMFGSTIADYIYSLEQAMAGAGVAWFRNLFPKPYYAYNAGSLQSVKTSAHKMVGKNLVEYTIEDSSINNSGLIASTSGGTSMYDMQVAKVIKGKTYTIKSDESSNINTQFVGGFFYNKPQLNSVSYDGTRLANTPATFTAPIDGYVAFRSTHGYTIAQCEFGSLQTAYEPYVKTEYTLNNNLELRGIPKLDANNKLYYDGDIYESSGKVTRKYGIVDLGTLEYGLSTNNRFISSPNNLYSSPNNNTLPRAIISNSKYVPATGNTYVNDDYSFYIQTNGTLAIRDIDYSDKDTFKTAMSGVYLVYELATTTTESSTPFANPQTLYSKGTEEYIDERAVAIPVGGDRTYVDIPDWMQNRYFDDVRSESSLVPEISNEVSHKAEQKDLTDIFVTGTKNNTGSTISAGTYFYVNGQLALCKQAISANADLTLNTNYELVTAGALNKLMSNVNASLYDATTVQNVSITVDTTKITGGTITCKKINHVAFISLYGVIFATSGNNQSNLVTGLPKALIQPTVTSFGGDDAAHTQLINTNGDTLWIDTNGTVLKGHISANTYNQRHYVLFSYPCE